MLGWINIVSFSLVSMLELHIFFGAQVAKFTCSLTKVLLSKIITNQAFGCSHGILMG